MSNQKCYRHIQRAQRTSLAENVRRQRALLIKIVDSTVPNPDTTHHRDTNHLSNHAHAGPDWLHTKVLWYLYTVLF